MIDMSEKTQVSQIKILHIGDVHLDTPYVSLPPEKSDERRIGLRQSFMKMMQKYLSKELYHKIINKI